MKTLLEISIVYAACVLFNSLLCWFTETEYTEAGTVRLLVVYYAVQWIQHRRSLPEKQNEGRNDQKG